MTMASSDANQVPTVDSWSDKDQQIQVTEGNEFLYKLSLRAKVDAKLDLIYKILVDPEAVDVFRRIKACTFRKVMEEDKVQRRRKLEVGHKSIAKFLCFTVNFDTHLHVWEDDINRTIRFSTAKEG